MDQKVSAAAAYDGTPDRQDDPFASPSGFDALVSPEPSVTPRGYDSDPFGYAPKPVEAPSGFDSFGSSQPDVPSWAQSGFDQPASPGSSLDTARDNPWGNSEVPVAAPVTEPQKRKWFRRGDSGDSTPAASPDASPWGQPEATSTRSPFDDPWDFN